MNTAPGGYLDMLLEHSVYYICSWSIFAIICSWSIVHSNMLLEHTYLTILPQIIHAPEAAAPGAATPGAEFRAKISQKLSLKLTNSLMAPLFFLSPLNNILLATPWDEGLLILGPTGPVPLGPGTREPTVEVGEDEQLEAGEAARGTRTRSKDVSSLIKDPVEIK